MCLHLALPGSSAAAVGYPEKEGKVSYEGQTVWKSLVQKVTALEITQLSVRLGYENVGNGRLLYTNKGLRAHGSVTCLAYGISRTLHSSVKFRPDQCERSDPARPSEGEKTPFVGVRVTLLHTF